MTRLALYFLLSGLTVAAGVLAVDSAQQVAEQIKVRQIAQCVAVNQVAPVRCHADPVELKQQTKETK